MKLFITKFCPHARKVLTLAHELQLEDCIELILINPWANPKELLDITPLGRVPALETEDGELFVESILISEYMMERSRVVFSSNTERMQVLARAALFQSFADIACRTVGEQYRPQSLQWQAWLERQHQALERTLPTVALPPEERFDLGDIALACALSFLDSQVSAIKWRAKRPDLATWLDIAATRRSMIVSML
jgi:glutathione S-transferase